MPRPDESLEDFMLWTNVTPRRRFDWATLATWVALALACLAFWLGVAWVIVSGMVL